MSTFYGNNNLGAPAAANFVPEYWSLKMLARFYESTILPQLVNTDFEGEIKAAGSTVRIRRPPVVVVKDYKPSGTAGYDPLVDGITYDELDAEEIVMEINQAKMYAFKVDDVLKAQADINIVSAAMKDAAQNMKIQVERETFEYMYTGVDAANQIGSDVKPEVVGADNVMEYVLELGQKLDEANIPESGRYIVIPPWLASRVKNSDLRQVSTTGDAKSPLRNGLVGQLDRFNVYQSNLLPRPVDAAGNPILDASGMQSTVILGGTKAFTSFATQVVKTEDVRLEKQFGDGVRGLQVYGRKVVQPTAGICMFAVPGTMTP
jgi:hypothetical protein